MHRALIALVVLAATLLAAPTAGAAAPAASEDFNSNALRKKVTVAGIMEHERAFQAIADRNGGVRASGTEGYDESVDYVVRRLRAAGLSVRRQTFPFAFFQNLGGEVFQRVSPSARTYTADEFGVKTYSGSGDVTANVTAVDVQVPPPASPGSTSGCEDSDFAGFPDGNIALIQRGTCTFEEKALNAQEAGASAVIIFNEGQPGRTDPIVGTLGNPLFTIPVIGTSFAIGEELVNMLRAGQTVVLRVRTDTVSEIRPTENVLADTRRGDPDRTIVVGAHLDSVIEGPGINDNGSGSSMILEIAEHIGAGGPPRNRLRFAFWGAEELGLIGSEFYVANLPAAQLADIVANLNFDMVGSPNYVRFVYDGDGSAFGIEGPDGSALIEDLFTAYFENRGMETEETAFDGRSDYDPFINVGIPAGGLFTGAEGLKTPAQAAIYGGTAGIAYDPCYHQACDTIANVNTQAIDEMSDAAAHVTYALSRTKAAIVNGADLKPGKAKKPSRTNGPEAGG